MKGYAAAAICALDAWIITNVATIALVIVYYLVSDTDISNQTITNGLEDCNAFGNFEWTAMIRSDNALCSGVDSIFVRKAETSLLGCLRLWQITIVS